MAVSKEELAQYVTELGLPQEQSDALVTTLLGNERAATQFVGQRQRHDDYTRKTQALAQERTSITQQANEQITQYAQQLSAAQNRITQVMSDLETETITAATANARLRKVKETYGLSDADIPAVEGVAKPAGTATPANAGTVDIDAKLSAFGNNLLKTIRQDMLAMPRVSAIQADISASHQELTGKRLSRQEMGELLNKAQKDNVTLEQAWEQQFQIPDLRMAKRDEDNRKKWETEWEAKQRAANSDAALAGVRPNNGQQQQSASPVLNKRFPGNMDSDPAKGAVTDKSAPAQPAQAQTTQGLSGAERAAAKYLERRANGIPMGAPAQTPTT